MILALNAGSSSLKLGLFVPSEEHALSEVALGVARSAADGGFQVKIVAAHGGILVEEKWLARSVDQLVPRLLDWIDEQPSFGQLAAIGHRVVHGGPEFSDPVRIDEQILARLYALTSLAPLHQIACLDPVRVIFELRPKLTQIACFDTAFHRTIAPPVNRYALPRKFEDQGIRRYGFHGFSFESIAAQLARDVGAGVRDERVIVAHLGNGASLCAMRDLRSVDTTMGFSTLDGVVMGTRPGVLDPGVLLYLLKEGGLSAGQLEMLLYRKSGLLGVSGISSDVGTLLASDAPTAMEALELFAFQVARQTGALAATLGGLERFVFTGGIGEHQPAIRSMITRRMGLFGAAIDEGANAAGETRISSAASAILIERRPTQEELVLAGHVYACLSSTQQGPALLPPM